MSQEQKIEFMENDDKENKCRTLKKKYIAKDSGASLLRQTITPELRVPKKYKKTHQEISPISEREQFMKEELHEMRIKLLKKELEIKENQYFAELEVNTERLKAAKTESDIKLLQKQKEETELRKLQGD